VDSLTNFGVLRTWIDGQLVAEHGKSRIERVEPAVVNNFVPSTIAVIDLRVLAPTDSAAKLKVIEALDGQLITNCLLVPPKIAAGEIVCDLERDILKLVVVNRYAGAKPAVAFIKNFGLRRGAIASSVAHDSHNVIAVGTNDDDLAAAVNLVMDSQGGLSAVCKEERVAEVQPLPVAGLMATGTCGEVATAYSKLDSLVKAWGSPLRAPYMTLSFMALLVIPNLKLSDRGLFDGARFEFTSLIH
jgi:adenine deaminase